MSLLDGLIFLNFFLLVLGILKPAYVLWFLDLKNRLKVLIYYGISCAALILVRVLIE